MLIKPGSSLDTYHKIKMMLLEGQVLGLPTETVYGLAGDATNDQAMATIFALKNRPTFNPLICHFSSLQHILDYCYPHPALHELAHHFWPGPLTVILQRHSLSISNLVSAGLPTLAVRIPDHPIALEIIERLERPLAAPSANLSESLSPTTPQHVLDAFIDCPQLAAVIDGGPCRVGIESTILDLSQSEPVLLRPGAVSLDDLQYLLGPIKTLSTETRGPIRAPGMTKRHYAPKIAMRIKATTVDDDEALLAFGDQPLEGGLMTLNLSPSGDLNEAACNLFKMLAELDQPAHKAIAVMPIPEYGIGVAINDRLRRGAVSSYNQHDSKKIMFL